MELTRHLRENITENRCSWLRSWGCTVPRFSEVSICLNEHHPAYNVVFDLQYPDGETADSQITYWAERIEQGPGHHKAAVWLDDYCRPGYLNLLLPDLGFRLVSTSYTLVAKPQDLVARKPAKMPIWRVKTGDRERKAWADVYYRAFSQADHSYNYARWMEAFSKQQHTDLQFYLGFRQSDGLGDYFPGKPSVVGQLITCHGVGGLYSIGTLPEHRGCGFTSEVVSRLITEASRAGLQHLYLVTQNPRFFEKFGFRVAYQTGTWKRA